MEMLKNLTFNRTTIECKMDKTSLNTDKKYPLIELQ